MGTKEPVTNQTPGAPAGTHGMDWSHACPAGEVGAGPHRRTHAWPRSRASRRLHACTTREVSLRKRTTCVSCSHTWIPALTFQV